jgi:hypothetical protein
VTINNQNIQALLKAANLYNGQIDGILGRESQSAIAQILREEKIVTMHAAQIKAAQALLNRMGFEAGTVDGKWGYNSQAAFDAWAHKQAKGKPLIVKRVVSSAYKPNPAQLKTPLQKDMIKFYGAVGTNQTQINLPFKMKLAWDLDVLVSKITIHQACAEATSAALQDILNTYGFDKIKELGIDIFGGSLNVRKMRGGDDWSMHSWGAAMDFDPDRNQLRWGRNRAQFGKPEYKDYLDIWEKRGATSLLLAANMDGMHVQFARPK